MKPGSILLAGIASPSFLTRFAAAAPAMHGAALLSCVKHALIGADIDNRIVTPSKDTYQYASSGVIL